MAIKQLYRRLFTEKKRIQFKTFQKRLQGILFLGGNEVECNVCVKTYKEFLPKGNGIVVRKNAECPNCGSLERTRLLKFYLENETAIQSENYKILHFAPEDGLKKWIQTFTNSSNYINADINPNLADYQMDIMDIKFQNNTFDLVICSHVLGHVPDELLALLEMKRVLKPNGFLILMTILNQNSDSTIEDQNAISENERLNLYGESDLLRLHGKDDIIKNAQKAGFDVEVIDYSKHFSESESKHFSLGNGEREIIFKLT